MRSDGEPFTFPGAWMVPPVAIVIIIWILAHATRKEFLVMGIVLAVASVLFLFRRKQSAIGVAVNPVESGRGRKLIILNATP